MKAAQKVVPWVVLVGAVYLVLHWLATRAAANSNAAVPAPVQAADGGANSAFYSPYYFPTAGLPPDPAIVNGSPTVFQSVNNINVNPNIAQYLASAYMPMFGFVGITTPA